MSDIKISQLTELMTANDNIEFVINDGGASKKIKKSTFVGNDFTTTLKNKLDAIESSATADQSNSEIKTAYELNADTNEFSDSEQSKLSGIEALADVTDSTNVVAALKATTVAVGIGIASPTDALEVDGRVILHDYRLRDQVAMWIGNLTQRLMIGEYIQGVGSD